MDIIDKKILDSLQQGLTICEKPFEVMADALQLTEAEVLRRIEVLKQEGLIRRVSGFFDSGRLGYKSTLCAVHVPEDQVERTAEIINAYDEVTHNYMRVDETYNMWFTIIACSGDEIQRILSELGEKIGYTVQNFPSEAFHKIKVRFDMGGSDNEPRN